ncbi:MAG TPA: Spy/CpxP family protein refolding chaperone [Vicinamibacterales bacterium]|nr:Spy/CpxP family protein refolding chaperone [Vicinamibacterales bacterium]
MTKTFKLVAGTALGLALVVGTGVAVTAAREQGPQGPGGFVGQRGPGGRGMRGPGGPGGGGGIIQGLRALDLTETQREQVKAAMESHKAEFEALRAKEQAVHKALNDAVTAETFDEGAVRQKAADAAIVEADGAVLRAQVHSEVWALLTPEQQAKAKSLRTEMEARRGQMRQRAEQRRDKRQERRQQRRQF